METRLYRIEKAVEAMLLGISELKESQKKTDEQMRKTDEQMRRTDAKLDRIGKQLADLGLVQGEVAEELFYRNLRSLFRKRYSSTKRSLPFRRNNFHFTPLAP
jgi:septation ring formation regulator EzrA